MPAPAPSTRNTPPSPRAARERARGIAPPGVSGWSSRLECRERVTEHLTELAAQPGLALLPQRRMPLGRGSIDLIAVGPGGVTVVGVFLLRGRVTIAHDVRRGARLLVAGRDHTSVVDELEARVTSVRRALSAGGRPAPSVRGALCVPGIWELAPFAAITLREVMIDGAETVVDLIQRPGTLSALAIERTAERLRRTFPSVGARRYET